MNAEYCTFHAKNALRHSLKRAYERYSIDLSELDIFKMSELVLNGKAVCKDKGRQRSIYKLKYMGKNFVLIFDYALMMIVTFLPHKVLRVY